MINDKRHLWDLHVYVYIYIQIYIHAVTGLINYIPLESPLR